mmetsp:Transcript_21499/g.32097  ORF Transcript_21499/g.32097 Transcript_21499/m.32097 type:complete len:161 (-) Transcript_21499:79-561(-)|eukprot:CAMPEP_0116006036 /NCGR_PEP_ID=MMETSP0321-20121206/1499_1 /TAXON_ID=163516 /ORGANISM="Leptocylindrus danicus var. danicus, Strain B650" /LENGTH=160 /DNA_ID=CAMNT_0003474533 /DNA_START=54 /DNA_END=536 /DNA_ORIENTATION=-
MYRLILSRAATSTSRTSFRAFSEVAGVGSLKTSTGLVGLDVDQNAVANIIKHNQALLDKMAASDMPETATYRQNVSAIANYRIDVCNQFPDDPEKVEEMCNMGQVEELVEQAKDEMVVLDMYLEKRYWEMVTTVSDVDGFEVDPEMEFTDGDSEDEAKKE